MWSPAAYLSDASASSNCPGTTATILSRRQSMAREAATSGRDGFSPGEPNGVSASPASHKSFGNRQAQSSNQAPRSNRRHNFCKHATGELNAGSSVPEVVTRNSAPCRTALQEQVLYGGREWPIRVVKWACFVDLRSGWVCGGGFFPNLSFLLRHGVSRL